MSRILFLTQVLPYPLDSGAKVRAYHALRHLARRHGVTLVSFSRADDTPAAIDHLRGVCEAVHAVPVRRSVGRNLYAGAKGVLTRLPMTIVRDENREMAATLRGLVRAASFDAIHADQLSMAAYGQLAARAAGPRRPRALLDEHNAVYLLTRRMAGTETQPIRRAVMAREAGAFARYEAAMCRAFDAVLTVTAEDQGHLLALFAAAERDRLRGKFAVIPICVDPDETAAVTPRAHARPTILHLGTMFWPPNVTGVVWFAREVLPLIHEKLPEARFMVVGKNPPPEVQSLGADPRIEVTGYVADPVPCLETADAYVVPLHAGGGMRVKILDGWLRGLPVISTTLGAEGIEYRDGENIVLADDAPAFARAVLRVLTEPGLNGQLRQSGRAWVETHYAWQTVYGQLDEVYERLVLAH